VRGSSNINVYSEYSGYFFTGFSVNNTFYVDTFYEDSIPISVTGTLAGETLVFNYNNTVGMWTASYDMGQLKSGKNILMVTTLYQNGEIFAKSYSINVLQAPKILLEIIRSGGINVDVSLGSASVLITFIAERTGYWNNSYLLIIDLDVSINLVRAQVDVPYIKGEYASPPLEFNLEFTLSSSGKFSVSGELSVEKEATLVSVPIFIQMSANAQGTFNVDFYEYTIELENIAVSISLSATGSYTLPTPLGISIQIGPYNINIGVTVEFVASVSGKVNIVFVSTDDRSKYFLRVLPVAPEELEGFVGLPFILTGQIGGGAQHGGRVGVWGWLQGACGFGTFLQLSSHPLKGYALAGAVRAGITVNLVAKRWSSVINLWSGSHINGDVSGEDLENLKGSINDVATLYDYPPLGFDWINDSWTGIVGENLPNGYSYTSIEYENKTYIYYTYERLDGSAWIDGLIFSKLNASPAPLPKFSGAGVASPFLFKLTNGTPIMFWATAPTLGDLSNLTIILQSSQMQNGVWTNPVNVTNEGIVWAYTSDGKHIYVIWSPNLASNLYSNTILKVFGINGSLLWEKALPNATALKGAVNGKVIVGFLNGTYSIVSAEEAINIGPVTEAGIIPETDLMYIYAEGILRIFNQTKSIEIKLDKTYAWPIVAYKKVAIVTYTPEKLELYIWNDSTSIKLREYRISNVTAISASSAKGVLYLYPYSFKDESMGTMWCLIVPLVAPKPLVYIDVHEDKATIRWEIRDPEQYNITSIELAVYHDIDLISTKEVGSMGTEVINLNQTGTYTFKVRVKTLLGEEIVQKTIEISQNWLMLHLLIICIVISIVTVLAIIFYQKHKVPKLPSLPPPPPPQLIITYILSSSHLYT